MTLMEAGRRSVERVRDHLGGSRPPLIGVLSPTVSHETLPAELVAALAASF